MEWRAKISTPELRALELAFCERDLIHWINHWAWTYDPRTTPSTIPFDLFPRQAEFLLWLQEREQAQEDGLVEKSRDMGATWLCCAYALHGWLFKTGYAVGFGSRKLELVDRLGDPDCIFDKLRFLLANLPVWMLPQGYKREEHDNHARLLNPENNSTITGEGGDNIGRGGRKAIYFVDEASFLERPALVERALSQTTRVRIDVSTPSGPGNPFYQKRFSGKVQVFTLRWDQDPRKDQAWYEKQCQRFDPVTVAQEIDIDYTASLEGICIPAAWVRAAVNLDLPASGKVVAGLDIAEEGKDKSVLIPRQGPLVGDPIDWGQCNTTETAHRAANECRRLGATVLSYDCIGVGAGVRGTLDTSERALGFVPNPVNVGASPTEDYWPDERTSKEKFINLRAELWWKLRARFERTYEHVTQGVAHRPEDMISIPAHAQLAADLSLPLYFHTDTGKVRLEGKDAMRKRGVKSPDFGDALALAFAVDGDMGTIVGSGDSVLGVVPKGVWAEESEEGRR